MMGSLRVEEPVSTSCSRLCTVNHWASASNYQLSNMKRPARDSNRQRQRLEASTLTATQLSPLPMLVDLNNPWISIHSSLCVLVQLIVTQKILILLHGLLKVSK